ncbi:MAG: glycoside hydrolase family 3 N-terminal domain-containing protein [Acidobacteriota bacterium]
MKSFVQRSRKGRLGLFPVLCLTLALGACAPHPDQPADSGLSSAQERWVKTTLASMNLEEKAAQMMMIEATAVPRNVESGETQDLRKDVRDLGVGGLVLMRSEAESVPRLLNELQAEAPIPLLVTMDMERSLAFRIRRGTVDLPFAMAVGATGSQDDATFLGEVTAREARALGIHWAFGPVVDVNNNAGNPVINIRSFGEDPEMVSKLGVAFIEGAHSGNLLTSAKHFPGHGDTAVDSHLDLPVLTVDRERLEAVEWPPFEAAIAAGVDSVMVGHMAVPALDPSGRPATLSPLLNRKILRDEMAFDGIIITDAMDMKGADGAWAGQATVEAVLAGADIILMPRDLEVAIASLVRGVQEGVLEEERLDASVRRILEAKAWLGLNVDPMVDPEGGLLDVGRPEDIRRADNIAQASITVIRNDRDMLPLKAEEPLRILNLVLVDDLGFPKNEFTRRAIDNETLVLDEAITTKAADEILEDIENYTHILVSISFRRETISPSLSDLLDRLAATKIPIITAAFGSPYALSQLPDAPVALCTYGTAGPSRRAAVAALFGEIDVRGKLPVTLSEDFPKGHGLEIPKRAMTLRTASPEDTGFKPGGMEEVDRVLETLLEKKAFPGGVLAVGHKGALVHLHPFGSVSYDEDATAVEADTIYDLASLTKVIATTTMAMILVDEERLSLDAKVQDFLPLFEGPNKDTVTVRHLLTHSSGLDWWAPLFEEIEGRQSYVQHIQAMDLVYEPGSEYRYSDLGIILLGEILSRVAGEPFEDFVTKRVFEPLGMAETGYLPDVALLPRIAPTENDERRGGVVHGQVHDENAHAMGGIAPHAGLFSTAGDLARFVQMIANGGVFEHHRLISQKTVDLFTKAEGSVTGSTRALGWDTKSPEHSSAGTLFSTNSFGHTGFTGTSIWIDPERDLFIVLLTNRVHPTRENTLIREARPAVADAVVGGLVK